LGNQSDLGAYKRLQSRMPFVVVDSRPTTMPDVDYVGTDHHQGVGIMVDYLCRVGRPPVFLAMPRVNFNAVEKENAYLDRMRLLGHEPMVIGTEEIREGWHYEPHGEAVMDACFSRGHLTDRSILCANDRVAIGALRAAAQHGLVPRRGAKGGLRIAGYDDYPLGPFTFPALTTVAQDFDAIAKAAVSRLLEIIHREDARAGPIIQLFEGALKLRESA